jgi:formyltetrahydrofolate deformylase
MEDFHSQQIVLELSVLGSDRKGVVSEITGYLFRNKGNIEQITQNVANDWFMMHLEASFPRSSFQKEEFEKGLMRVSNSLNMEIKIHYQKKEKKRMAVFVTKELHCLQAILEAFRQNRLKIEIPLIISNRSDLAPLAAEYKIAFYKISFSDPQKREKTVISLLEKNNIDFIVLARYMKILSPSFVWRYPNRIINIHPSLLPAFPGAFAYTQAYERGVKLAGCSVHFVTPDLDQGPIICQDAFQIYPEDTLKTIRSKGQKLEARLLLKGIHLFLKGKLEVYWGKVRLKSIQ